jgi:hypothetical protein
MDRARPYERVMRLMEIHGRRDEHAKETELRHRTRDRRQEDAERRREKVIEDDAAMNGATDPAKGFGEVSVATPCYGFQVRPDRRRS